ncbi:Transcription factor SOX-8 [Myotis davidii]|uniref:Transcription factor SOX-8 n=1 Tax=Myotis davidii TaxID=225400 RepID=L5LQX4_MYODS|nr:Transcription factor SOX-8 [Myotis davidii]
MLDMSESRAQPPCSPSGTASSMSHVEDSDSDAPPSPSGSEGLGRTAAARRKLADQYPHLHNAELSKTLGKLWRLPALPAPPPTPQKGHSSLQCVLTLGQTHGPPTPPTTPKTDLHQGGKQELKLEGRRLVDSGRQNIDFSNVDISELSSEVIGNMDTFDVHEFDQYLPLNGHSALPTEPGQPSTSGSYGGASYSHSGSAGIGASPVWAHKGAPSASASPTEAGPPRPHIKTEQLSPGHYGDQSHSSPGRTDYSSYSAQANVTTAASAAAANSFTSSQCDYTDLQAPNYYNPYAGYPSSLYQYPYFHSSRRPYTSPLLSSLSVPPAHSPPSNWDQPVYTTLTRP